MKHRRKLVSGKSGQNRKRQRPGDGFISFVKKRSDEKANRRLYSRGQPVWAAIAAEDYHEEEGSAGFLTHVVRVLIVCLLLPISWVTTWVFLLRFSHVTLEQGFWHSQQFWYFAVGVVVMLGWFWSRIAQPFFLYCYVFGHELTHAAFVKCFGGRILDMDWGTDGGYVTTDKTNWVIALSPYFVPFWSVIAVIVYVMASLFYEITPLGNQVFYGVIGATWSFHLAWTLWMIPRDQPDLKDNGTGLSLVLIYFGNLVVLIGLLCLASPSPLESLRDFGYTWFTTAMTWGDVAFRWLEGYAEQMSGNFRL
jgi:hypothetical protein